MLGGVQDNKEVNAFIMKFNELFGPSEFEIGFLAEAFLLGQEGLISETFSPEVYVLRSELRSILSIL